MKCQVSGVCLFARALTKIPSPLAAVALKCTVLPRCFSGSKYCPPLSEDRKKMCTVPQCLQICPLDLTTCAFILMPCLFFVLQDGEELELLTKANADSESDEESL